MRGISGKKKYNEFIRIKKHQKNHSDLEAIATSESQKLSKEKAE